MGIEYDGVIGEVSYRVCDENCTDEMAREALIWIRSLYPSSIRSLRVEIFSCWAYNGMPNITAEVDVVYKGKRNAMRNVLRLERVTNNGKSQWMVWGMSEPVVIKRG